MGTPSREDLLRLMVTLKSGKTTAHRIFKRLNAYAKQNPLLAAMKEYGKIIKSGFILRYYDEREFRQAIELQLSHIELVNRFSKAVFFGNNQEYLVSLKEVYIPMNEVLRQFWWKIITPIKL